MRTFYAPKKQGFTLIEILIAVAIMGILAIIALPQYDRYIVKTNRAIGLNVLYANMLALEEHKTIHGSYPGIAVINATPTSVNGYLNKSTSDASTKYFYTYNAAASGANHVLVTMTANNVSGKPFDENCAVMSLNTNLARTATNSAGISTTAITDECFRN